MAKVSKERQEKTLAKMKERRKADYIFLRSIVKKKLKWAESEKEKALNYLEVLNDKIANTKKTALKLEGIIIVLKELANITPEKEDKKDG